MNGFFNQLTLGSQTHLEHSQNNQWWFWCLRRDLKIACMQIIFPVYIPVIFFNDSLVIVHPKMKIVLIYSPLSKSKSALLSVLPHVQHIHTENWNCITLRLLCCSKRTQKKIFWRMVGTKQLPVAVDFHSIFSILLKSMDTSLVPNILQNIFFCVQQKKEIILRFIFGELMHSCS